MQISITTHPFGAYSEDSFNILNSSKVEYQLNPKNRKLKQNEILKFCKNSKVIVAGTEKYDSNLLSKLKKLKLISRVGIGLDNIDLNYCKKNNILVSYTPDAPTPAVAELALGLSLSLLRMINLADNNMREKKWNRYFGRNINNSTIGIIGYGRIGSLYARLIKLMGCKKILVNDIRANIKYPNYVTPCTKNYIYKNSNLISIHTPLTKKTKNLISKLELKQMSNDCLIVNTSRGNIINERDLYAHLIKNKNFQAALDVFHDEPYNGNLLTCKNILFTSHMGSMSIDCRSKMELEATTDAIRFINNKKLYNLVKL